MNKYYEKIQAVLEENFVEPRLMPFSDSEGEIVAKVERLNDYETLCCAYTESEGLRMATIARKSDADSVIDDNPRNWNIDNNVKELIVISDVVDEDAFGIWVHTYDEKLNGKKMNVIYSVSDDGSVRVSKCNADGVYESVRETTAETIVEVLAEGEFDKIVSGNIKTSSMQM